MLAVRTLSVSLPGAVPPPPTRAEGRRRPSFLCKFYVEQTAVLKQCEFWQRSVRKFSGRFLKLYHKRYRGEIPSANEQYTHIFITHVLAIEDVLSHWRNLNLFRGSDAVLYMNVLFPFSSYFCPKEYSIFMDIIQLVIINSTVVQIEGQNGYFTVRMYFAL